MNVTQILLGTTAAMLLMALLLSFNAMKDGEVGDQRRISYADLQNENLRLRAELTSTRTGQPAATPTTPIETPPSVSEQDMEALKEQNRLLKEKNEEEARKRKQAEDETLAMNKRHVERHSKAAKREKLITQALLMGVVKQVHAPAGTPELVIVETKRPNVREGTRLAIRRGTGIIGLIEVTRVDGTNCFAEPLLNPGGVVDVKVGDELILPPQ
ncbi:MAG: hypothetical protein ACPG32_05140 [Akkermansiaceae bacterium]